MYYRDPTAEDKGIMDGVIDLNTVAGVTPVQVARNYGFQTVVSINLIKKVVNIPVTFYPKIWLITQSISNFFFLILKLLK